MVARHLLQHAHHVITQRDGRRKLPLDIARERKRSSIVRLLTEGQTQAAVSSGFSGRGRGRGHVMSGGPPGLVQSPEVPSQEIPGDGTLKSLPVSSHVRQNRSEQTTMMFLKVPKVSSVYQWHKLRI